MNHSLHGGHAHCTCIYCMQASCHKINRKRYAHSNWRHLLFM